jgi:hypothetical protein
MNRRNMLMKVPIWSTAVDKATLRVDISLS